MVAVAGCVVAGTFGLGVGQSRVGEGGSIEY